MGKAKNKKTAATPSANPDPEMVLSTSPDYDSEMEFEEVQQTLEKSLSHDHLTWMRHVIRVQAEDILKARLKQEFEKEFNNRMSLQLGDLKKKIGDLEQEVDTLTSENAKRKRQIERLEYSNSKKQSEIDKLRIKIDEFEQDKYSTCVQIVGFPENKDESEDTKQLTKVFKEKAGVKIKSADVVEMRRMGKRNNAKTRNIILKFKDKETKEKVYAERKKLIQVGSPRKSVYLNDCLTQHRQQLLYSARQLVKGKKLYAAWSQHGNILVRKSESSKITQIIDNTDLMLVKTDESDVQLSGQSEGSASQMTHLSSYDYYCDSDI